MIEKFYENFNMTQNQINMNILYLVIFIVEMGFMCYRYPEKKLDWSILAVLLTISIVYNIIYYKFFLD